MICGRKALSTLGTTALNARSQPESSVPLGSARLTALPSACCGSPVSSGNPVPGNSVSGVWWTLTVSTRGSS